MARRLIALVAGALAGFILLEGGLRLYAFLAGRPYEQPSAPRGEGTRVVLFVGNSHTYGVGADPDQSYPAQLQRLLSENPRTKHLRVVNVARPNMTTSRVLDELPDHLEREHPLAVYMMVGEPNMWNLDGYIHYSSGGSSIFWSGVSRLKSVQLVSLLLSQQSTLTPRSAGKLVVAQLLGGNGNLGALGSAERNEMSTTLRKYDSVAGPDPYVCSRLAIISHLSGDDREAGRWMDRGHEASGGRFNFPLWEALRVLPPSVATVARATHPSPAPDLTELSSWFLAGMLPKKVESSPSRRIEFLSSAQASFPEHGATAVVLSQTLNRAGRCDEAVASMATHLTANPLSRVNQFSYFLDQAFTCPDPRQRVRAVAAREKSLRGFRKLYPDMVDRMRGVPANERMAWAQSEITDMVHLVKRAGSRPVLHTYPPHRLSIGETPANQVLRGLALELGTDLVESEKHLEDVFASIGNKDSFYSDGGGEADNHLGSKGYSIIARQLMEHILTSGLLP